MHHWKKFCSSIAFFAALSIPVASMFSRQSALVCGYVMLLFWFVGLFFGGQGKKRLALVRSTPLLWLLLPLIFWSLLSIFRHETSLAYSIRYWFGHYPHIIILVLATLFTKRRDRFFLLSLINGCVVLDCMWNVGDSLYSLQLGKPVEINPLVQNTISYGITLTLLGGFWVCFPYTSRHLPSVRKMLPPSLLNAMKQAGQIDLLDLLFASFSDVRNRPLGFALAAFRWGMVIGIMAFLFLVNPSRTAQITVLVGYSTLLLTWHWKKGILAILFALLPFAAVLAWHSETLKP